MVSNKDLKNDIKYNHDKLIMLEDNIEYNHYKLMMLEDKLDNLFCLIGISFVCVFSMLMILITEYLLFYYVSILLLLFFVFTVIIWKNQKYDKSFDTT